MKHGARFLGGVLLLGAAVAYGQESNWPTYRYDAARRGYTSATLPRKLQRHWRRQLARPLPAWPRSQSKLRFDAGPSIVVAAGRVFAPSSRTDSVTALDAKTGDDLWTFYAGGPVRLAPVATAERVYFVSDDGYLYCVGAGSGKLRWKSRGGPRQQWILGNERLISTWPARGGPVLHEGKVYFTAGIWPMMGIFVHAVDATTGETIWTNGGDATKWTVQPHGAPAFASVVPQGYLAIQGDALLVPGGRSVPALYDLKTGRQTAFHYDGKRGGHVVFASDQQYHVGRASYELATGKHLADESPSLLAGSTLVFGLTKRLVAQSVQSTLEVKTEKNRLGKEKTTKRLVRRTHFNVATSVDFGRVLLQADWHIVTAGESHVRIFDVGADALRQADAEPLEPVWTEKLEADVWDAVVAGDRLFVTTTEGAVVCFGPGKPAWGEGRSALTEEKNLRLPTDVAANSRPDESGSPWSELVDLAVSFDAAGIGYAVVLGAGSDALVDQIIRKTEQPVVVVDPDPTLAARQRRRLVERELYGPRVSVNEASITSGLLPEYLASLVVVEKPEELLTEVSVRELAKMTRPYGGTVCLMLSPSQHARLGRLVKSTPLAGFELSRSGRFSLLRRMGPLPGAGQWTHQYADATQSGISMDRLVRAPLGVLWFGGPSNDKILPRHGHGPSPQVAGGRIVIEGPDLLRALDVYTGRLLWEIELPGLGKFYDNTRHAPGAGEIGSNYVTLPDAVYVVYGEKILKIDPSTGRCAPLVGAAEDASGASGNWGYLGVSGDHLVAGRLPVGFGKLQAARKEERPLGETIVPTRYASGSRELVVFDRHTGQTRWRRTARYNFRHNAIAMRAGSLFLIDRFSDEKRAALARRGVQIDDRGSLVALDLQTGREIWSHDNDVFGTFLSYSAEHDILLQAGSLARDRAYDEVGKGMIAYRGATGQVLWRNPAVKYQGPCLLWRDKIMTNGNGGFALDLTTGEQTGWSYQRKYGCNTAIGCQNLLTFRSGAAGYYDLVADAGTSNLGGFRSSCTNNLIPADGLLCAPDYTRTCNCAYQNQTSVAFIHRAAAAQWSFGAPDNQHPAIGLNFGAPGDRRSQSGTLWLDVPSVGGESPDPQVSLEPDGRVVRRVHPSEIKSSQLPWVFASAVEDVSQVTIPCAHLPGPLRVRLFFAELDRKQTGNRRFNVLVKGAGFDKNLDIALGDFGPLRGIIREVTLPASRRVSVTFQRRGELPVLISGIEVTPAGREHVSRQTGIFYPAQ